MPLPLRNLQTVDTDSFDYIFEKDVDIHLPTAKKEVPDDPLLVRANVYRPKAKGTFPVLVTYGPYGKDISYQDFHAESFRDVNPKQKSAHSAWETPDPKFWTAQGYALVRADERGAGNSPGKLDTMSRATTDGFFDVVEWAARQPWSSGKVGLLGISYYAGSQWRVAARRPKGLAAIVPWEGMTDYYRDRVRQGGILSNTFIKFWYDRQVGSTQYGLGGRAARNWGPDSLEGVLPDDELAAKRAEQPVDTATNKFLDDEYFATKDFDISDVEVPLLSVANWGAIHLHLRGNVMGFLGVSSKFKYLRFLTGRHDVPFYYDSEVAVQKSFLDAFLKGSDDRGWTVPGKIPPVDLLLRIGNPGINDSAAEARTFKRRYEDEWPLARTQFVKYNLTPEKTLTTQKSETAGVVRYEAPKGDVTFHTTPFIEKTEVTGHIVVRVNVSLADREGSKPSEIDLFLTLRHFGADGNEISYTGAVGDPVPLVRGWQRVSLRATSKRPPQYLAALGIPVRDFLSADVQPVDIGERYSVDVELWPTNVVLLPGESLGLQISSCDTEGVSFFQHNHPDDRVEENLKGWNEIHFGPGIENWIRLPFIPEKQ